MYTILLYLQYARLFALNPLSRLWTAANCEVSVAFPRIIVIQRVSQLLWSTRISNAFHRWLTDYVQCTIRGNLRKTTEGKKTDLSLESNAICRAITNIVSIKYMK